MLNIKYLLIMSLINVSVLATMGNCATPTNNSSPIPTMQDTQNADTVRTEKVQSAIVKTASLKGQHVSAAYHAGTVTLQGSVQNKLQQQDAINAAKTVQGVKKVDSQLTIKAGS